MSGLDDKAFKDFNDFMTGTLIPGILLIADKHNYDRDDFVMYTATILSTMAQCATFENYIIQKVRIKDNE